MKKNLLQQAPSPAIFSRAGLFLFLILSISSFSQVSQEREIKPFTAVENRSSIDMELFQGTSPRLIVEADESVMEQIETWVEGETLYIDVEGCLRTSGNIKIILTVTDLTSVRLSGSGNIESKSQLRGELLNVELNGSGDADLDVVVEKLNAKLNGSGDMTLLGDPGNVSVSVSGSGDFELKAKTMEECVVKLTGSGDIYLAGETAILKIKQTSSGDVIARDLKSASCLIEKSGSGDTSVYVDGELSVTSSGSGDTYYRGNTTARSIEVTGSGEVRKIN
jgi:hypothetical protein